MLRKIFYDFLLSWGIFFLVISVRRGGGPRSTQRVITATEMCFAAEGVNTKYVSKNMPPPLQVKLEEALSLHLVNPLTKFPEK